MTPIIQGFSSRNMDGGEMSSQRFDLPGFSGAMTHCSSHSAHDGKKASYVANDGDYGSRGEQETSMLSDEFSEFSSSCSSSSSSSEESQQAEIRESLNESQLNLRRTAQDLLTRMSTRMSASAQAITAEVEEEDWDDLSQGRLRRHARGLLRMLNDDMSEVMSAISGMSGRDQQSQHADIPESYLNESQLNLRRTAQDLLTRMSKRRSAGAQAITREEEEDWDDMSKGQLRRNARGLLKMLGDDISDAMSAISGMSGISEQSVEVPPCQRKRFPVPEEGNRWRFVAKAKKSEGYNSHSAGRVVEGVAARDLVSKYEIPTNAEINQNAEKEDEYYEGVGNIISSYHERANNTEVETFEAAYSERYRTIRDSPIQTEERITQHEVVGGDGNPDSDTQADAWHDGLGSPLAYIGDTSAISPMARAQADAARLDGLGSPLAYIGDISALSPMALQAEDARLDHLEQNQPLFVEGDESNKEENDAMVLIEEGLKEGRARVGPVLPSPLVPSYKSKEGSSDDSQEDRNTDLDPTLDDSFKTNDDKEDVPKSRCVRKRQCVLLVICVIFLAIVGSVCGVMLGGGGDKNNESEEELASVPVLLGQPSFVPSPLPSTSIRPSSRPSLRPSQSQMPSMSVQPTTSFMPTAQPTTVPSSSAQPSSMPTRCSEPRENPKYAQFLLEYWNGVDGIRLYIPNRAPDTSTDKLSHLLEVPKTQLGGYAARATAYITAPETGAYNFYVVGDDRASLILSNSACKIGMRQVASCRAWAKQNDFAKYPGQKSGRIDLVAGDSYYLEVRFMNGPRGGFFQAAWSFPSAPDVPVVIDGQYFSLYPPFPQEPLRVRSAPFVHTSKEAVGTPPPVQVEDVAYTMRHHAEDEDRPDWANSTIFS